MTTRKECGRNILDAENWLVEIMKAEAWGWVSERELNQAHAEAQLMALRKMGKSVRPHNGKNL